MPRPELPRAEFPRAVLRRLSPYALLALLSGCVVIPLTTGTFYPEDSQPTRPWPAAADCPTPAGAARDGARLLALVNGARAAAHLPAVALDPAVRSVAQHYACENAARQSIEHVGSDGSTLLERFRRGGLMPSLAAENTGIGYASVDAAFAGWMASPPHKANILRPEVTRIGLGLAQGARQSWVLDFFAPR